MKTANKPDPSKPNRPKKLELSHSSCTMARSCPQKYHWHYIEGYKPIRKSNALALGSIIHSAHDMYYSGFTFNDVIDYISKTMDEEIANASITEQEDLLIAKYTALGMWVNCPNLNLSEFDEIKSEKEFRVRLGNMRNMTFVGRSDRLVKKDGKWWIGELKTSGIPFQAFCNKASVSDQVTAYVYAWQQLGYPVQGVIFDYIKKPLLRKRVNDDASMFGQRIIEDYKVRSDIYYGRHFEYRGANDVKRWLYDTKETAKFIRRIWKGERYRNTDNCWNYNSECPYKKICFTDVPDPLTVSLYFTKETK